ncbi:hypothetical protein ACOMHN_023411 [Nucella lapillus]
MEEERERSNILLVFDFDHTMIDANADLSLSKLSPGGCIPDEIQSLFSSRGWIKYMDAVFRHLHKHSVSAQNIQRHMESLPLVPGMSELFEHFRNVSHYDIIMISDCNSVLIDNSLKHYNFDGLISQVFTNPAEYNTDGCLLVRSYHVQDWCSISTINLCKGRILQDYIQRRSKEGKVYSSVVYVGDGANDLCPGLTLRDQDYLLPRKGFTLWKKLEKRKQAGKDFSGETVKASVIGWDSAVEIRTFLESLASGKAV